MTRIALVLAVFTLGLSLGGCISDPSRKPPELSQEQVCMAHAEHDPAQRARCTVDASIRNDTPPDVRPMDLPVRNGQIGD